MPASWLMKSEPDVFSIDDLKREGATPWTGVRNYQARNFMRDTMRIGDRVLFYHSNAEPAGVAGIAEVASAPYPDPTQFDAASDLYEPRATEASPVWMLVDVRFVRKFGRLVSLAEIRETPSLRGMALLKRGQRLSIQPVSAPEFEAIVAMAAKRLS